MADEAEGAPAALPPGHAELYLPMDGGRTVLIAVDAALVASVNAHRVEVEGGRDYLMVVTDTYASRDIADGEEVYVRVLEPVSGEEKWSLLARSSTLGLTAAQPLLQWAESGFTFTLNLTGRPPLVVSLGAFGDVDAVPVET